MGVYVTVHVAYTDTCRLYRALQGAIQGYIGPFKGYIRLIGFFKGQCEVIWCPFKGYVSLSMSGHVRLCRALCSAIQGYTGHC